MAIGGAMRFKNRRAFDRALATFAENTTPELALVFQKKIAVEVLSRIIDKNPVGNPSLWQNPPPPGYVGGRSRANWQLSVNSPNEATLDAVDASGAATVATGLGNLGGARPFGSIFIFNNVRYITALENGHSTQAPSGMVGVTLAEIEAFFARET